MSQQESTVTDTQQPEPRVIPRSEHSISRKNIDREALKVLYRLRDAGHAAYLVGGGVRDLYLGKTPKDFDISTDAHPGQLRKIFKNSRIIGRRFRLVQVFFRPDKIIEVATFRCSSEFDLEGEEKVLAANNTFGSPVEDAFRRDLTINALFYEVENFTIIDYVGGVDDLNNKIVRIVGDPDRRIIRDPVRMLRAIRHAARSNFTIEPATWAAILTHRDKLNLCPDSRIRDEFFKDLRGGASRAWAELALESEIFFVLLPFYRGCLVGSENADNRERLLRLLAVVDRLHGDGVVLPEEMLFAMLLLVWAEAEMGLGSEPLKGQQAFAFSRQVRSALDANLAALNIKRATREVVTGLLVNLPICEQCGASGKWPKWLQKKSYFRDVSQFYALCREAESGKTAEVAFARKEKKRAPVPRRPARKRSGGRRSSRQPAFAKGGIFGLKK